MINEEFEFNQDIDYENEIKSPGWLRYQKELSHENTKQNKKLIKSYGLDAYIIPKNMSFLLNMLFQIDLKLKQIFLDQRASR